MKNKEKKALGIYLHIPFCVRKCKYCDFLSFPAEVRIRQAYVECLKEEIRSFEDTGRYQVKSIFFGGGTPSLLEGEEIAGLVAVLKEKFGFDTFGQGKTEGTGSLETEKDLPEITVECNPGTLTAGKLQSFRACGINRLSMGLQSADEKELEMLGRIHTWEEFRENYEQARLAGFDNINVDLMSSLPEQTEDSWERTLRKVLELKPEHISAYSLIIEEGTPFYEMYGEEDRSRAKGDACASLPDEDTERAMYYGTQRILAEAGFHRYEISNYARPGRESVHNCGYWQRREYAGFGLGASSQLNRLRYKNTESLEGYLKGDFSKREVLVLTKNNEIEETMYLGLRMMQGVDLRKFENTFGVSAEVIYKKELERLTAQGLIRTDQRRLQLTERGIDLSNQVMAEFLLD